MAIGRIISMPYTVNATWASVRDENGSSYTVDVKELPRGAEEGDEVAYRVDIMSGQNGLATTLVKDPFTDD